MKIQIPIDLSLKFIFFVSGFFLANCSYSNRYVEQAKVTGIMESSTPTLRKSDDVGGLSFFGKIGIQEGRNNGGDFRDLRKYVEQDGKFGEKVNVLVERQFGKPGQYFQKSQNYFFGGGISFFTDSPLGIDVTSIASIIDGRMYYVGVLGGSLTFTSEIIGAGLSVKYGLGNSSGNVDYFELDSAYLEDEPPELIDKKSYDVAKSENTMFEIGTVFYYNSFLLFTPFVSGSFQVRNVYNKDMNFKEMTLFSKYFKMGGRFQVKKNVFVSGMGFLNKLSGFDKILFGGEMIIGYDLQF